LALKKPSSRFRWVNTSEQFDFRQIGKNEAAVLIGDQCFEFEKNFAYNVDLAGAWKSHTGLPFVFACWAANKKLPGEFISEFNAALKPGVEDIDAVVQKFGETGKIRGDELKEYLTRYIDYNLDNKKMEALSLFLHMLSDL
jgi:chorismate dehydratase